MAEFDFGSLIDEEYEKIVDVPIKKTEYIRLKTPRETNLLEKETKPKRVKAEKISVVYSIFYEENCKRNTESVDWHKEKIREALK